MKKLASASSLLTASFAVACAVTSCTVTVDRDNGDGDDDRDSGTPVSTPSQATPSAVADSGIVEAGIDGGPPPDASLADASLADARVDASSDATSADGASGDASGSSDSDASRADVGVIQTDPNVFRPAMVPMTSERVASLTTPAGFSVGVFGTDLGHARMLAVHQEHVYVTRPMQGDVLLLSDSAADDVADTPIPAITGLDGVHGIAFSGDSVYLATVTDVWSATVQEDGTFGEPNPVHTGLPDGGQHPYRTLAFGPDGALYISIGSDCDACAETNPEHATILRAPADGQRAVFASGLRNTIGFGWHPVSGGFWGMDNGSDMRGDRLPPEELNQILSGRNYGWPYCFADRELDPIIADPPGSTKAEYCPGTEAATLVDEAHGAPIGMVFYTGDMFPAEYVNDAFVAMRGSWNRFPPSGYQVNRIHFDDAGQPAGFEPFVSGFLSNDGTEAFARVAGLTVHPDGSLLISDDTNGVVYRVVAD